MRHHRAIGPMRDYSRRERTTLAKLVDDMTVKPTGVIDRDFVAVMVPHHQAAIDMAKAELRYGKSEQLRRIAQEIIVDQLQEIGAMKLAIGDSLPPSDPSPTLEDPVVPWSPIHSGPMTGPHDHMHTLPEMKK
jgi:Domain of unknown function (DUF305)